MIKKLVPDYIQTLTPYPPGKPIEELEREYGITDSIKLASNENPLGPSPRAMEAIREAVKDIHRYPDGSYFYLKKRLGELHGLTPDHFIIGNGSNEIIEFLIRTLVSVGDEVIVGDPSFIVYRLVNQAVGGKNVIIPLKDWKFDLDAMKRAVTDRTKLIFIDNPNNPVGTAVTDEEFSRFISDLPDTLVVVLDEAYKEFTVGEGHVDFSRYMMGPVPIVSTRTFSKLYGLSGLRVGYGVARPDIISMIHRIRSPFNVNHIAQAAAVAALDDNEFIERTLAVNKEGMDYLYGEFERMGLFAVESHTNFILLDTKKQAADVYEAMLNKGVIVRSMKGYGLPTFIRVTVGTPEENRRFIAALDAVLAD
ncbi:MAG: histidinol-phosphate transaminase [Deltaproteobacteria bacterium]|nr:histidinol-phosphate transaminase [Candidatus Zymogenaceae bacterium]